MQKKFLRTSVLTLVMGLSLLTESLAMAPDMDYFRAHSASRKNKIEAYKKEASGCYNAWNNKKPDKFGNKLNATMPGLASGLEHERWPEAGWESTSPNTGIHNVGCDSCMALSRAVAKMLKDGIVCEARECL